MIVRCTAVVVALAIAMAGCGADHRLVAGDPSSVFVGEGSTAVPADSVKDWVSYSDAVL